MPGYNLRVLIIGATGNIGSYLIKQLVPLGYEVYARRFGHEPKINYVSKQEFLELVGKDQYEVSMDHITHSPCCTCAKSIELLGVKPKYTIIDIICEYLEYQYKSN